jgi:hypothetical protein
MLDFVEKPKSSVEGLETRAQREDGVKSQT